MQEARVCFYDSSPLFIVLILLIQIWESIRFVFG